MVVIHMNGTKIYNKNLWYDKPIGTKTRTSAIKQCDQGYKVM